MSGQKIQIGQVWKKNGTKEIYLVTRLYSEALNTMAILRKSGAGDGAQIRVRVARAGAGQTIPGFSPAQDDERPEVSDLLNLHFYIIFEFQQFLLKDWIAVCHANHLAVC